MNRIINMNKKNAIAKDRAVEKRFKNLIDYYCLRNFKND
jgi:hypothetical protein